MTEHPDRCEFCGIELTEQTEPIFIPIEPGPPPASPEDWSGWRVLGYTQEGHTFGPDFREIPLDPIDIGPRSVRIGPITTYHPPEEP